MQIKCYKKRFDKRIEINKRKDKKRNYRIEEVEKGLYKVAYEDNMSDMIKVISSKVEVL